MKKIFATLAIVCVSFFCGAQTQSGFGFKAGINYNGNGDYVQSITNNVQNPDRNIGFHFGVFGKLNIFNKLYFRPELLYTKTKSNYDDSDFNMQKIDAPLLLGVNILGPLSVFAGPSFQYIVDSEFGNININDIKNDFTVGLNLGVGVNFKKFGIDLRYERGFSNNEALFIENNLTETSRLDTRPDQLILGISLLL